MTNNDHGSPIHDRMANPTPIHDQVRNAHLGVDVPVTRTQVIDMTPDKVIPNRDVRRHLGTVLYVLAFLAGVAALFLGFFPEFDAANNVLIRVIAFVNATISLASGAFGLVVTIPNVPKR